MTNNQLHICFCFNRFAFIVFFYRSGFVARHEREKQKCGSNEARKREHRIHRTRKIIAIAGCDDTAIRQGIHHTINHVVFEVETSIPRR